MTSRHQGVGSPPYADAMVSIGHLQDFALTAFVLIVPGGRPAAAGLPQFADRGAGQVPVQMLVLGAGLAVGGRAH